ncbi:hypothetical protein BDR06DRAFT_976453 [Suillus hirtellus]|nr:hypothetical protein BDR06DRAFT_976453 [Suillus hirtellus]
MGRSKAIEVTPPGTVHLMKWCHKKTTRGIKGWLSEDFDGWGDDQGSINPMQLPKGWGKKNRKTMASQRSPNEYLWQWKLRVNDYLEMLLEHEAPPLDRPIFCTRPFHRIRQWNGDFFERTTLTKLGVEIHLGHRGHPCPHSYCEWEDTDDREPCHTSFPSGTPGMGDTRNTERAGTFTEFLTGVMEERDDRVDVFLEDEHPHIDMELPGAGMHMMGKTRITVADTSGIHIMSIWFCRCLDAISTDKQLFEMGMFPASFAHPKTAFTFALLNNFIRDNVECGTSASNYYSKLRQMTSSVFPHSVPVWVLSIPGVDESFQTVEAAELLKWHRFGHERREPHDGELALFCPSCPQPGINATLLSKDNSTPQWLHLRSLVMDGNFKAKHLHPTHPEDEVWLTDGKGFMVGRARYWAHLAIAKDLVQRSECNNHRAVNQANASWHNLEATGIGGCMCARHGCFIPNAMVDFQKGERQLNMNYALCNALSHNTDGIGSALTFYDVNCQYHKHFRRQVDDSLHMSIPSGMDIILGIGLWHVHRHQDKCFAWYASNFIPGAARIDGEIMETLWAPLNVVSPSCWGMSTPHRQECLDYQMNDCNFMKMIWMAWSRKEAELNLLQTSIRHPGMRPQMGSVTWIASGITIEETQIALVMDVQRIGRHPTESQNLEIGRRHVWLQQSIDQFITNAARYIGEEYDATDFIPDMDIKFLQNGLSDSDVSEYSPAEEESLRDRAPGALFRPELVVIPLPSNLGPDRCEELGVAALIRQEITLQEGQANDILHIIRVHLADKAVLFQTTVWPAKSQVHTTRAWAQVHLFEQVINLNSMIYKKCRSQLSHLGADHLLVKYQELLNSHLKATLAVADPNAQGQRDSTLPWFWLLDVQGDSTSNDWLSEFYWVHWLRSKALWDCWAKEFALVAHEMRWTVNFFTHKRDIWLGRVAHDENLGRFGLRCYTLRQAQIYKSLAEDAQTQFVQVNPAFDYGGL